MILAPMSISFFRIDFHSLLIAALSAQGTSIIHNIEQIDRGYENIDERLQAIGAKIKRIA